MSNENKNVKFRTKQMAVTGMLGAVATVLMLFDFPLPFAPGFYKLDLSEAPVLVGTFALGPVAGILIELVKVLLNFLLNGTTTAGVGELANFCIGCAFCVPAGIIYRKMTTRKGAVIGLGTGVLCMTVLGCFINAYVMLPVYSKAFHMPVDKIIEMGTKVNSMITNLPSFVAFAVAPFNLLKGLLTSVLVFLVYKKISRIIK